jgi:class 3 adenylate cyclase
MGKNVNLCSRLEGYANNNRIIISEELNELIMDKFDTNKLYIRTNERMKSFKHIDHVYEIIRSKF